MLSPNCPRIVKLPNVLKFDLEVPIKRLAGFVHGGLFYLFGGMD